jgi:hypothetical protein
MTTLREAAQQALEALDAGVSVSPKSVLHDRLRAALAQQGCTYTVKEMDGFGTLWATECGEELYVAAPEAIGFSLAPMPNEDGKFCQFCGNKIVLEDQK